MDRRQALQIIGVTALGSALTSSVCAECVEEGDFLILTVRDGYDFDIQALRRFIEKRHPKLSERTLILDGVSAVVVRAK